MRLATFSAVAGMTVAVAGMQVPVDAATISMSAGPANELMSTDSDIMGEVEAIEGGERWTGMWTEDAWDMSWDITHIFGTGNPTPQSISSNIVFTNTSEEEQEFVINTSVPATESFPATLISGWLEGRIDIVGGSGTVSVGDDEAMYSGLLDGDAVRTLNDGPFTLAVSNEQEFYPDPFENETGPALNDNLGIGLRFSLTPGDTLTLNSNFEVIPEPASLALLGAGGLLLLRRRRHA